MGTRIPFDPGDSSRRLAAGQPGESEATRAAAAFWIRRRQYAAGEEVIQVGGADVLAKVISGWACDAQRTPSGAGRIFAFWLPGDLLSLRRSGGPSNSRVLALSRLELGQPTLASRDLTAGGDLVGIALGEHNRRLFGQIVRLGALNAEARTAHLLLEFHGRLSAVGLVTADTFRLPLTQDVFASALGLSLVHVNRTLQRLRRQGLITLRSGSVTLHDLGRLRALAEV